MRGIAIGISGVAKVYCVHDREKRELTDPEDVSKLGASLGIVYDARKHKIHLCACCENLFVASDDTPRLCTQCMGVNTHPLGGPLPEPEGVIS